MKLTAPFLLALIQLTDTVAFAPCRHAVVRGSPLQMGILNRFRKKKTVDTPPQISPGSKLPEVDIQVVVNGEGTPMDINEALGNGTAVLVGMPGAFTPTCSSVHLPGYVQAAPTLSKLGVDKIAVLTTNDQWVNDAWGKQVGIVDESKYPFTMISDGDGELVRELGLVDDMGFGVGIRSKRFAMVVNDGTVSHVEVDAGMDECESSSAENLIKVLTPPESSGEDGLDEKQLALIGGVGVVLLALLLLSQGDGTTSGGEGGGFQLLNDFK